MRRIPMESVFKGIGISLIVLYAILAFYHLGQGFDWGDAFKGPFLDVRAFFMCWNDWGELKDFISRPALLGKDLGGLALDEGICK